MMKSLQDHRLHICFLPMTAQGHAIPAIAMAKLLSSRGLKTTIITTPLGANLHSETLERSRALGLDIGVLLFEFPCLDSGLPKGCESAEFAAARDEMLSKLLREHCPDCLVADVFFPWAVDVAAEFRIPALVFHGTGFFALCASLNVLMYEPHEKVGSDSEPFVIPNLPDEVKLIRKQVPPFVRREYAKTLEFAALYRRAKDAELRCFGVLVNSFLELEPAYADHYRRVLGRKAWHVGPLSLLSDKIEGKGKRAIYGHGSVSEHECLKWLDSKKPDSVVYVCFGSTTNFTDMQLMEIAVGLEASGQQFVWVVKKEKLEGVREEWVPEGFEERLEGKGLIVRGWAPQVMILEHKAIGGFVTHCGWNSTLEGVCAGVPMVTWPVGAEQFYNEKLVTQVLKIGVEVGAKKWERLVGDFMKREMLEKAVRRVMEGEEAEGMRERVRALAEMASKAVEEGGSSHSDLNAFIDELRLHRNK